MEIEENANGTPASLPLPLPVNCLLGASNCGAYTAVSLPLTPAGPITALSSTSSSGASWGRSFGNSIIASRSIRPCAVSIETSVADTTIDVLPTNERGSETLSKPSTRRLRFSSKMTSPASTSSTFAGVVLPSAGGAGRNSDGGMARTTASCSTVIRTPAVLARRPNVSGVTPSPRPILMAKPPGRSNPTWPSKISDNQTETLSPSMLVVMSS